jgi:hypothetical protein
MPKGAFSHCLVIFFLLLLLVVFARLWAGFAVRLMPPLALFAALITFSHIKYVVLLKKSFVPANVGICGEDKNLQGGLALRKG